MGNSLGAPQNEDKRAARRERREDFEFAIREFRKQMQPKPTDSAGNGVGKLHVSVRKRPLFPHERRRGEFDVVTVQDQSTQGYVYVHDARMRPDMKHMFLQHHRFTVDKAFAEDTSNDEVYHATVVPLLRLVAEGGSATCLMFGQTGSGKTYTMTALQERVARDLLTPGAPFFCGGEVSVVAVEVQGSSVRDLMSSKDAQIRMMKDASGRTSLPGVQRRVASSPGELLKLFGEISRRRESCATAVNSESSRSHAVCRLKVTRDGAHGELTLVDLAGSERSVDSAEHNAEQTKQSAQINASLAVLKECLRVMALHSRGDPSAPKRVPFRDSKLTMLLEPTFTACNASVCVIATVSPGSHDTEHSVNTLRHVQLMDPSAALARPLEQPVENRVMREIQQAADALPPHPAKWKAGDVERWWHRTAPEVAARARLSETPSMGPSVDGKALVRFSKQRFAARASGGTPEHRDAFGAGMLEALQEEIGRAALQDQVRREALRAAAHGDRGSARRIMGEVQNKGVPGTGSAPMRGASKAGKKASERRLKEAREAEEFLNQMR